MKKNWKTLLAGAVLVTLPGLAIAAPYATDSGVGYWTGPYAGGQIGINEAGGDNVSTETAFTGGVHIGYNAAVPLRSTYSPLIVGADAFVDFNGETTHTITGFRPVATDFGSDVYGIDALAGIPMGVNRQIMPYLKLGFGTIDGTGDLTGSDTNVRVGLGAEYRLQQDLGVTAEWMHQDADRITNNNFTIGVNYHFGGY